jgi:hypothetical protein
MLCLSFANDGQGGVFSSLSTVQPTDSAAAGDQVTDVRANWKKLTCYAFFSVGRMDRSNSEPPMEKRMNNQQFDSGIFCFQLPSLVMLATVWDILSSAIFCFFLFFRKRDSHEISVFWATRQQVLLCSDSTLLVPSLRFFCKEYLDNILWFRGSTYFWNVS